MNKQQSYFAASLIYVFVLISALLSVSLSVNLISDPAPFVSSYWDMRWVWIFALAFISVLLLFVFSKNRLLIIFTLLGYFLLLFIPVFTINIGKTYLVLIILLMIARDAGQVILEFLLGKKLNDSLETIVLSLLFGLGLIMMLVMIQGWLNAFIPWITWLGLGLLFVLFVIPKISRWWTDLKNIYFFIKNSISEKNNHSGFALVIAILLILVLPSWLIALSPPMRYDEMTYHLSAPLLYLQNGGIVPYPEGGTTYWMHFAEMLFTTAIQTAGLTLPRLLHLLMAGLSGLVVYLFGKRLLNKKMGVIAALLFLSVPLIGYESSTAYIDLFITAYTSAVALVLLIWWQEGNPRLFLLAGALGGIGLGIKLTAGPLIALMAGLSLIIIFKRDNKAKNFLYFSSFLGLVLLLALPWLIRDTIWTGDPFYPYGTMFLNRISSSATMPQGTLVQASIFSRAGKYFTYFYDLIVNSTKYYHEAPGGMAGVLPLLALPLFVFLPSLNKSVKKTGLLLLLASIIMVWIMLLVNNALMRYAMPIFPWLSICAALNIEGFLDWLDINSSKLAKFALTLPVFLLLFSSRLPLIVRMYDNLPQRFPINYFLGRESKEQFLSRNLPVYEAFQFIDAQEGTGHKVFSVGNEFRLYSKARIDGIYDVKELSENVARIGSASELAGLLERSGYDYILINQPEVDYLPWKYVDPYPVLQTNEFLNTYARLVFIKNGILVYHFDPSGVNLPVSENTIINGDFEKLDSDHFSDWQEAGSVKLSNMAYGGENAIQLFGPLSEEGDGYVMQKVPVLGNQLYTLQYWTKSTDEAVFLMQLRWYDQNGNMISVEEDWENVPAEWGVLTMFTQSPKEAAFAEVYASLGGSGSAFVDDICLAQGQYCPDQ